MQNACNFPCTSPTHIHVAMYVTCSIMFYFGHPAAFCILQNSCCGIRCSGILGSVPTFREKTIGPIFKGQEALDFVLRKIPNSGDLICVAGKPEITHRYKIPWAQLCRHVIRMCVCMFRPLSGHPLKLLLQNRLWEVRLRSPSFVLRIVISVNCVNLLKV